MNRKQRKQLIRIQVANRIDTLWDLIAAHMGGSLRCVALVESVDNVYYLNDKQNFLFKTLADLVEGQVMSKEEINTKFMERIKSIQEQIKPFIGKRHIKIMDIDDSYIRAFMDVRWRNLDKPTTYNYWLRKAV